MTKYILSLSLILILAACAPETPDTTQTPDQLPPQDTTIEVTDPIDTQDEVTEGEVVTVEIEAGSYYYSPEVVRVNQGDTVRLVMNSVDMMHDLNIDELGVNIPVTSAGNTSEVTFVADQAGEFEMYCSVSNHRTQGQIGTLIVE